MINSQREGTSWATVHLAQMTTQIKKERSPTPVSSAVAPQTAPLQDPDAPLNLTKPKSLSSGARASSSPGSDSHSTGAGSSGQQEQPLAATAPQLFQPGLPMPRNYLQTLPYAGLPPHLGSMSSPSEFHTLVYYIRNRRIFAASHIAQNIAETCQKYLQSFIVIEILPQHFCQLFQNITILTF